DAIKLTISQGDAITTTSYTVKVESNNPNIYTGEVTDVVFTVSTGSVEKLDEVITVKDLGALDNAEDATVKAALKDKNNDLDVDAIKLTISQGDAITTTSYTVKVESNNPNIYTGEVTDVVFTVSTGSVEKLDEVITVKDLGALDNAEDATVKAALKDKNNDLDVDAIKLTISQGDAITTTSYTVKVESNNPNIYTGEVTDVVFTVSTGSAEKLDEVITVKDLGALDNAEDATVKAALKDKNNDLDVDAIKLTISQADVITTTSYTVKVESNNPNIYTGEVTDVVFTVTNDTRINLEGLTFTEQEATWNNETTETEVIYILNTKFNLIEETDKLILDTDVTIKIIKATQEEYGIINIVAVEESQKVTGNAQLMFDKLSSGERTGIESKNLSIFSYSIISDKYSK
ncbi:hypothetical protein, partial [Mesoplasma florum]|uniref:hypothetical protein n=1 Tax=Mesoplasma florum TaxID=2151 RepID=UPI000D2041A8